MTFTSVPLSGWAYRTGTGVPAAGSVTFAPTTAMRNGDIVVAAPIVAAVVNGVLPSGFTLAATDDPGTTPTGVSYWVTEDLGGGPVGYFLLVPRAAGAINLGLVDRAQLPPAVLAYAPLVAGKVPSSYLPASAGGGGAVDSVAGRTGVVVLARADVGLGSVDNTADAAKPVSTLQASALASKADATALTAEVGRATAAEGSLSTAVSGKAATVHAHAEADVTGLVSDLAALTSSVAGRVASVTAVDATIAVAGTAAAPTVGVGAVPQAKVTNLVTDLSTLTSSVAGRVASVAAADTTITVAGTATAPTLVVGTVPQARVTSLVADLAARASTVHVHAESDVTSLVADLAGKAGLRPIPAAGWYVYTASASATAASATLANGNLRVTPWFVEKAVTIVRIGAEVTVAGDVGSKLRLGMFGDNGACYPGALLLDAGQIAGDVVGVQELTISLALTPGLYWPAAVVQAVTTTQPTIRSVSNWTAPVPLSPGTGSPGGTMVGYLQSGVTAALSGPFSSTVSTSGASARVFVRFA